ncbi:MAG: hypothetical protein IJI14_14415 [Anaerolineaceae bacterium]|nr:hypothetical protein [Anaerolineaceae bacterium]
MTISSLIVLVFAVLYYFLFKRTDKNKKDPTDPAATADKQETPAEEKEPIPPAASSPPPPPAAVPSFPQPQAKIKPSPAAEQRQAIKHTMKDVEELEKRFLRLYHRSYDYPDLRCGSFGSSEFSAAARETDLIEIKNEFIRTKEKINAGLDFLPGFLKHMDRSDPDKAYSILKANEKLFEVSAENSDELYREMLSLFSVVSFTENEHDEYYSKAVKALSGLSEAGTIDIKPSVEPHDLRFLNSVCSINSN